MTVNVGGDLERSVSSGSPALYDELVAHGLSLDALEDALIQEAMHRAGGNLAAAARALGLTRPQLSYRLQRVGDRARAKPMAKRALLALVGDADRGASEPGGDAASRTLIERSCATTSSSAVSRPARSCASST